MEGQSIRDRIADLGDWLRAPANQRNDSRGALVVLGEIRDSHQSLLAALRRIAEHDPDTCDGITPRDCLDAIREITRAAIARAEGGDK